MQSLCAVSRAGISSPHPQSSHLDTHLPRFRVGNRLVQGAQQDWCLDCSQASVPYLQGKCFLTLGPGLSFGREAKKIFKVLLSVKKSVFLTKGGGKSQGSGGWGQREMTAEAQLILIIIVRRNPKPWPAAHSFPSRSMALKNASNLLEFIIPKSAFYCPFSKNKTKPINNNDQNTLLISNIST